MQGAQKQQENPVSWKLPLLGYSISVACLVWVYRGFDWSGEAKRLAATQWWWVVLAIAADIAVYLCQGVRWSILLRPLVRARIWKSIQAIYIGLFANEVLPLRSGEVIRCYLQRRWTGLPLSVVISSAVMERILDGIWLVAGFWLVSHFVALPGVMVGGSRLLIVLLVFASALIGLAVMYKGETEEAVARSRWGALLRHIVGGVHNMGRSWTFLWAAVLSLAYLLLQIFPILFLIWGYGLDVTGWAAPVVLVVLRLGTVLPQAPGNVGSFQALTILALGIFQIPRDEATGFATLLFFVVTMPLWLAGFIALLATRMRIGQLHKDAHEQFASEG